ncbi:hypothetical protein [Acidiphilium sp.]|uniref:hypothetical protein n=1 Tax=Acidiphilium sp. TaxID=527 RepID=UPI002C162620|nr:hypothetical protein [Acidiphilium sp.]HQT62608.1 hypothetical protein [Acidiphilium sp.]
MTQFNMYPAPSAPLTGAEQIMVGQTITSGGSTKTNTNTITLADAIGAPGNVYTVAKLPTGLPTGSRAFVSDATAPTYLGALTGGGSVFCRVMFNGTEWVAS